ncbi:MAG: HAD family phosphatase [Nocardiopsaceae bacterium]|nr:HAD family phosphatase [Nocardiopsaceae bacterium]
MRAVRLAAIDLDGTLLRGDGSISARSRATLKRTQESGIITIIATARDLQEVRGIDDIEKVFDIAICCSGAVTYDLASEDTLTQATMSASVYTPVIDEIRSCRPGTGIGFVDHAGTWYCDDFPWGSHDRKVPLESLLDRNAPVLKVFAFDPGSDHAPHDLVSLVRDAGGSRIEIGHRSGRFVEILAAGAGKLPALRWCCVRNDIAQDSVIAFGDSLGDVEMLRWAGIGVAVRNAVPEVRRAAVLVAPGCDEDGVARTLELMLPPVG